MSEYVYLYRGGARDRSPEQMQQIMQKWMAWLKDLGEKGHIKDRGQPLERTGKLVAGKHKTVTDGPFAEAKDVVGGYTLIEAGNLDAGGGAFEGLPDLRARRRRGSAAGHEAEHVDGTRFPLPARSGTHGRHAQPGVRGA